MSESSEGGLNKRRPVRESVPNGETFEGVLSKCSPGLLKQAKWLTRNLMNSTVVAEELVQETLLKALESRETFQLGTNMGAWTRKILKNKFNSHFRKQHLRREVGVEDVESLIARVESPDKNPESILSTRTLLNKTLKDIGRLPLRQRQALELTAVGSTPDEIADEMSSNKKTVKANVFRGRQTLRGKLSGEDLDAIRSSGT